MSEHVTEQKSNFPKSNSRKSGLRAPLIQPGEHSSSSNYGTLVESPNFVSPASGSASVLSSSVESKGISSSKEPEPEGVWSRISSGFREVFYPPLTKPQDKKYMGLPQKTWEERSDFHHKHHYFFSPKIPDNRVKKVLDKVADFADKPVPRALITAAEVIALCALYESNDTFRGGINSIPPAIKDFFLDSHKAGDMGYTPNYIWFAIVAVLLLAAIVIRQMYKSHNTRSEHDVRNCKLPAQAGNQGDSPGTSNFISSTSSA